MNGPPHPYARNRSCVAHPVNTPDRIQKRSSYGQLFSLRPACSQNQDGSFMPDATSRIRFGFVLPKKARILLCKKPALTRSGWPCQDLANTHLVRKQTVCRNHRARFWQTQQSARYQFPHFQTPLSFSTDGPDGVVKNQPGSQLVFRNCGLWARSCDFVPHS